MSDTVSVPAVTADASAIAHIKSAIDISERSRIVTFGDRAQRSVVEFADRILAQTQNRELGTTGKLLSDILAKARGLDPAALRDGGFLTRLFSSMEARLRRFTEQFGDVASQIDRVCVELDRNKETLRRDIAILDDLHEQTKSALGDLDSYIAAGKSFAEEFRRGKLVELEQDAKAQAPGSDALLAAAGDSAGADGDTQDPPGSGPRALAPSVRVDGSIACFARGRELWCAHASD